MKKFVIVLMVLGIVSAANAALTWSADSITLNLGETAVVQIISDIAIGYKVEASPADGSASGSFANITAVSDYDAAGDSASGSMYSTSYPGWWDLEAKDTSVEVLPNLAIGAHWDITITADALNTGTQHLSCDYYNYFADDILDVVVVPEPITVALLGLGGLFLRRRK